MSLLPIYGVPLYRFVGGCTSQPCGLDRHLLFLLNRFAKFSRDERPDGSLPAFAWGDVADSLSCSSTPIRPITERFSLSPSSFTRNPIGSPYDLLSLSGQVTGLPRSAYIPSVGLGAVFPPVVLHLRQRNRKSLILSTYLLVQACQRLWLVTDYDVYQQFTYVHLTIYPSSRPP